MSNIPEEAVESAAKVLFCMQHRLSEKAFATAQFRGLADAARREARNALTAAAPHLRAAWAEEVRAIDIPEHRLHDQLPSDHRYAGQKAMRDEIVTLLEGGGE